MLSVFVIEVYCNGEFLPSLDGNAHREVYRVITRVLLCAGNHRGFGKRAGVWCGAGQTGVDINGVVPARFCGVEGDRRYFVVLVGGEYIRASADIGMRHPAG